jgi:T-complex protein 1 subunit gamma
MLKMILDAMGGIVMTNDGNCILREIDVSHPAARSMIELSRAQDEQVGDGTTSVIVLAGEMLQVSLPFLHRDMHPTIICRAYNEALQEALRVCEAIHKPVNWKDRAELIKVVKGCIGTKFVSRWGAAMCDIAVDAVLRVATDIGGGKYEIDIKRYAKVEKIPGGELSDCRVMDGVMFNKDVTHPRMSRRIENPRVLLLDCGLEYKKGESEANVEISNDIDFDKILQLEEEYVQRICNDIIELKPTLVCTEKGVSDLAQHFLMKAGITVIRRLRKTDNNRIARACGATIVHRTDEIREADLGVGCGLFEIRKIADEYYSFMEQCKQPKACTILLRGGSKDVLNEIERNLQDAMQVARNVVLEPKLLPGGGATEMTVAVALQEKGKTLKGVEQWPYRAAGKAFEVIPRTLMQNCGADVVRNMTSLRAKHAGGANATFGVDGTTGKIVDMNEYGVWEPFQVKVQTMKTAIESCTMLLRIDDIVSGVAANAGSYEAARQGGQLDGM